MSPQAPAIFLYRRIGFDELSAPFGKLVFGPVTVNQARAAGVLLSFDYVPTPGTDLNRWLRMDFHVASQRTAAPRRFGTAGVRWLGSRLLPSQADTIEVEWLLLPEDLERIELDHGVGSAPGAPWTFQVTVEALASGPGGVIAIDGEGTLSISASDWQNVVRQLGFGLGPGAQAGVSQATHDHPQWLEAEKRLARARELLRAGEGRAALTECLSQFEALVRLPYRAESWRGRWAVPPQKEAGLVSAFSGHCAYLNKIGHHRDATPDAVSREHKQMPLDQWEAELVVAASHQHLAYALRLDSVVIAPPGASA
jgi:hypothetical protein